MFALLFCDIEQFPVYSGLGLDIFRFIQDSV
jgi:hypothetical protein